MIGFWGILGIGYVICAVILFLHMMTFSAFQEWWEERKRWKRQKQREREEKAHNERRDACEE